MLVERWLKIYEEDGEERGIEAYRRCSQQYSEHIEV
jgi:hypothetical protein